MRSQTSIPGKKKTVLIEGTCHLPGQKIAG